MDVHLSLLGAGQTKALTCRYQLAYAYRMVNTAQVDEYVERALVAINIDTTLLPVVRWTLQYEPTQLDYVGSAEATEFFRQHEHQSRSRQPVMVLTDTDGVVSSSADLPLQTVFTSSIVSGHLAFIVAGVWGTYADGQRLRERRLPNHFGAIDLPLREMLSLTKTLEGYQVQIGGQVDRGSFEKPLQSVC